MMTVDQLHLVAKLPHEQLAYHAEVETSLIKQRTMLQESLRASYHYVPQGAKVTAYSSGTQMRARGYTAMGQRGGRARSPPPDLPSLLLDARIVYIGMPLVASVTELVVSELLWLQYADPQKPIYMYINSIGSQEDFQAIGFETEAYAIQDTMNVRLAQACNHGSKRCCTSGL
jgi:hypothetical protein